MGIILDSTNFPSYVQAVTILTEDQQIDQCNRKMQALEKQKAAQYRARVRGRKEARRSLNSLTTQVKTCCNMTTRSYSSKKHGLSHTKFTSASHVGLRFETRKCDPISQREGVCSCA